MTRIFISEADVTKENSNIKQLECRVEFVKIGQIDTREEYYGATVKIKTKWYENEIIKKYDPEVHWNPKIYIENAIVDVNYFQDVSYEVAQVDVRTEITETRKCKGRFWERIELSDFPLGLQKGNNFLNIFFI